MARTPFVLLNRDPTKGGRGWWSVRGDPAGEFQPSCLAPACMPGDPELWRNSVRGYSEELPGEPEYDGSSGQPVDYERWPLYHAMQCTRESGSCGPLFWVWCFL
jgi:hypothetical protein